MDLIRLACVKIGGGWIEVVTWDRVSGEGCLEYRGNPKVYIKKESQLLFSLTIIIRLSASIIVFKAQTCRKSAND